MDIKNIILKTRKYNLHSHTQFCDGRADMQTMAAAAVDCGMLYYGFTPHSPIPIESPCNMSVDSVNKYFDEIEIIRQKPEFHTCRFYAGMEVDYLGDSWGPSNEYFRHQPLDYTIGSVHFIPTQDGDYIDIDGHPDRFKDRMRECFRNDIEYVIHTFYQQTAAMIIAGGFDILTTVGKNAEMVKQIAEQSGTSVENVSAFFRDTMIYTHGLACFTASGLFKADKEELYAMVRRRANEWMRLTDMDLKESRL